MKQIKVGIVGLGLLGTSLALALKRAGEKYCVHAWARRHETLVWAQQNHVADICCNDITQLLDAVDIVVLSVPVPAAVELLSACAACGRKDLIVTDIGSVKNDIMMAAAKFPELRFIGSHPMAGTEKSGCEAAFAGLYDNADVFVTPGAKEDHSALEMCSQMWRDAGCARIEVIAPEAHDELVAATSHVLHLLASAMTLSILDGRDAVNQRQHFAGCATGFRDTTRIASSNPRMWREIMESNTPAILDSLARFEECFREFKQTLVERDFDKFESLFEHGKLLRGAWLGYKKPRPARVVLCGIKHCGKSSVGKELSDLLPAPLVDTDDMLADVYAEKNGTRLTVREIYRTLGDEGFRKLENECLERLADEPGAKVIALGGGALSNPFVQEKTLSALGTTVWLDVPDSIAWERVKRGGIPPFLADAPDPEAAFRAANAERKKQFERHAALRVSPANGSSPRDTALTILGQL